LQISQLTVSGGTNIREAVRRAMQTVLAHNVEMHFNWSGVSGPKAKENQAERRAFSTLKLSQAVRGKQLHLEY